MAEFAARADLGPEQFLRNIGQEGVAPETFRDFVANGSRGATWCRPASASAFGAPSTRPDVDEALAFAPRLDSARILLPNRGARHPRERGNAAAMT